MTRLIAASYVFLAANSFAAESKNDFVKYVDDKGTINFVDDIGKIPPQFRSRVEPIDHRRIAEGKSRSTVFSFRPGSKLVIVSVKFNDRAAVRMWVNQSSEQSILSTKAAKEVGIDPRDASLQTVEIDLPQGKVPVKVARVEKIDLQGRMAYNLYFAISDFADTENYNGILGRDFLNHFHSTLDINSGRLTLEDKEK